MMERKIKVLLSGGGTGGHIFPAIAIAQEIKSRCPNSEFLFIGANGKMEMKKVPEMGFAIKGLDIVGFDRSNLFKNISLPIKLAKSIYKAKDIVKEFKPDFAIGTGGFASGPALYAAATQGVKTYIQEQNAYAGVTNKILAKSARKVFTAYPTVEGFPKEKTIYLGNPIRESITNGMTFQTAAKEKLGLDPNRLVILSVGGSLGSKTINEAWKKNLSDVIDNGVQLIWQTGSLSYDSIIQDPLIGNHENVKIHEFISDMALAYSAADIIVSRAGAIAISELSVANKPVILVPFPYAAEDHQTKNAMSLVEKNAARMVKDSEMDDKFMSVLNDMINNKEEREAIAQNLKLFAKANATKEIVDEIIKDSIL